jgi:hypothetical protein
MIRVDHIHRDFVIISINIDSGGNVSELSLTKQQITQAPCNCGNFSNSPV